MGYVRVCVCVCEWYVRTYVCTCHFVCISVHVCILCDLAVSSSPAHPSDENYTSMAPSPCPNMWRGGMSMMSDLSMSVHIHMLHLGHFKSSGSICSCVWSLHLTPSLIPLPPPHLFNPSHLSISNQSTP